MYTKNYKYQSGLTLVILQALSGSQFINLQTWFSPIVKYSQIIFVLHPGLSKMRE